MASHDSSSSSHRRALPQPVETSQKTRRKFAPEPIEQTAKSMRRAKDGAPDNNEDNPVRRMLPQPTEISSKHYSKTPATSDAAGDDNAVTSPDRNLPQPVESSKASSKAKKKFAPQLMETTRRSRKRTDTIPAILPSDKNEEYQPHQLLHIPKHLRPSPVPPVNSPIASSEKVPQLDESRFAAANLAKREPRRHSFRVPELARIASSESEEESKPPSPSNLSATRPDERDPYKHATHVRESADDRSSGYLLSLAAKVAEQQLRDQVLAAYPNEHDYERVAHFAVDQDSEASEDEEAEEGTGMPGRIDPSKIAHKNRDSAAGRDMAEMRQHQDELRQQHNDRESTKQTELDRRKSVKAPFADPAQTAMYAKAAVGGLKGADKQEWREMRKAASPPMAGGELKFPKCQTPRQTRLDVGSYPTAAKISRPSSPARHSGLWTPGGGASREGSASGLWMGVCAASAQEALAPPEVIQSGLLTPSAEQDDPFAQATGYHQQLPLSPPSSLEEKVDGIDNIIQREKTIEEEFNDAFITQIYNYLSLGYPALARKFDFELSKITKIPVEDLRRDDSNTNAKGYVGAPEGSGSDVRGMQDGQCERWLALRLYIREWARQQPNMAPKNEGGNKDWGATARKGSWAF